MMKKVLLIVANEGFKTVEYKVPKDILIKGNVEVFTASNKPKYVTSAEFFATGSDGFQVKVDMAITDVNVDDFDGIFLIGGPGALEHLDNYDTYKLFEEINLKNDRAFGAICISVRILANAGVLNGRSVTGWDEDGELLHVLDSAGAHYIKTGTVIDDNLITSVGPANAKDFGSAILKVVTER